MARAEPDVETGQAFNGERVTDPQELLRRAREVVRAEADAVRALENRIGQSFLDAVTTLAGAEGRIIVSGIGKSGVIARKIAATLTSTGTPAIFLHPVEALHGDLGIVTRDDVAVIVSKSGESDELEGLTEYFGRLGVKCIVMSGQLDSSLARSADVVLDCSVQEEACPLDLAPTTSTTTTLALGDALAVALLLHRGFSREDFARIHPGGALGKKVSLRVHNVMVTRDFPSLAIQATMKECVVLLAEKRGTVPIVDHEQRVVGVVTAGDLTRLMEHEDRWQEYRVDAVMNDNPKVTHADVLAASAVYEMETHGIMAMPVVDDERHLMGIVHLHDLMRAGAV